MPNSPNFGLQQNAADYGCFHQRFYGAISCFFVGDNLPVNVPWICHAYLIMHFTKTTVNFTYLGVDNTAPLGIISAPVEYPYFVELHLL
jgi:hypothetical protein